MDSTVATLGVWTLVASVFFCLCECVTVPENPCPQLFKYKVRNDGYYYGEMQFENDRSGNFVLEVNVSIVGYYRNKNIKLELTTSYETLLAGGNPVYFVHFPFQNVLPKLTRAQFNGRVFCSGPPEPLRPGGAVTNMWAKNMLYTHTYNNINPVEQPVEPFTFTFTFPSFSSTPSSSLPSERATAPPLVTSSSTSTSTTTSSSSISTNDEVTYSPLLDVRITEGCGLANDVQSLVVNGEKTREGEFPWLAALMYRKGFNYEFRCTANLVDERHVITAAHCVQLFKAPLIQPQDMLVVLGKYRILDWANGDTVLRDVSKVFVHPSYEQNTGSYDVAIITLSKPVQFSKLIRPVCLWGEEDNLEAIVGKEGTVAGWGKDETGADYVAEPKKVTLPVVTQEKCLRSDRAFVNLTSDQTFCAGNRDGKGPCTGDSGAGFTMLRNHKWTLRGIVSLAVEDPVTKSCDTTKYFVFADVAKLTGWIKEALKS